MNIGKFFTLLLLNLGMAFSTSAAENAAPDTTIDGLHRVDGTVMSLVYTRPWMNPARSSAANSFLLRLKERFFP